jgi:hypothetical protein
MRGIISNTTDLNKIHLNTILKIFYMWFLFLASINATQYNYVIEYFPYLII